MKQLTAIVALIVTVAGVALAGGKLGTVEAREARHSYKADIVGTSDNTDTNTWKTGIALYRLDKTRLAASIDSYDAARTLATNSIEQTTGDTRTALRKVQNETEELKACILSLRAMIQDLKSAMQAVVTKDQ